MHYFWNLFW